MQNVADMAEKSEADSGLVWEGSSFKESSCCFVQDLWELHFCILCFYKVCCNCKKNPILQRWISGPGWKPGSGEGNDGQGQRGGALGEIFDNV